MFWIITITIYKIYIRTAVRQAPMFGVTVAINPAITNSGSSNENLKQEVVLRQNQCFGSSQSQNIQVLSAR